MEFFQETRSTPLAHTLLNSSSKASRLGCGSCARISEVMVSSPGLDKAIRKALIVNGSLKSWSSAGSCPPWTLQNAHSQRRICAPGNPQNDYCYCLRPKNTSLRAVLSPCWLYSWHRPSSAWNCWSGTGTGHFHQRSPDLPEFRSVIQARTVLSPKGLLGVLDDFLGNSLDTPVFLSIDRRPCPLQPLAGLSTFPYVVCALVSPVWRTPGFTIRKGRPGNVPEGDFHQ